MFGGNASAEGGEDDAGADTSEKSGIDIVLASRLAPTSYTKDDYRTYIKV